MTTKTEIYVLTAQNADGPSKSVKAFSTESDAMDALRKCIEWMATLGERDQSILYRTEGYKPCKALTAMCPWGAHVLLNGMNHLDIMILEFDSEFIANNELLVINAIAGANNSKTLQQAE